MLRGPWLSGLRPHSARRLSLASRGQIPHCLARTLAPRRLTSCRALAPRRLTSCGTLALPSRPLLAPRRRGSPSLPLRAGLLLRASLGPRALGGLAQRAP
ncbi:hypothetical protein [Microbacterium sp. No. 7]|uniref:hypothetical protein n=1 Tax=Microbacterium sp. No. 7 TaxID=1714373 RepID=UPI0018D15D83|nr:hypothetical protein [Microbacterium sp. No. 7]